MHDPQHALTTAPTTTTTTATAKKKPLYRVLYVQVLGAVDWCRSSRASRSPLSSPASADWCLRHLPARKAARVGERQVHRVDDVVRVGHEVGREARRQALHRGVDDGEVQVRPQGVARIARRPEQLAAIDGVAHVDDDRVLSDNYIAPSATTTSPHP
jgi:hypothetical protein